MTDSIWEDLSRDSGGMLVPQGQKNVKRANRAHIRHRENSQGPAPSFMLQLNDKGSGEVDLHEFITGAVATFTRATTATTINSAGLIVSVGTGVARSYYDPTTLQYNGYLAEDARTNLCLQSETHNVTWVPSNGSIAQNVIAPDGTLTAWTFTADGTNTGHVNRQTIVLAINTTYTFPMWLKAGTNPFSYLQIGGTGAGGYSTFNLSTGALGATTAGLVSREIKTYPNGWCRCCVTITTGGVVGSNYVEYSNSPTDQAGAVITSGTVIAWGAQLEAGTFASSYIPTTTVAVTRNADVLTYPISGNISNTVGSIYTECSTIWATNSTGAAQCIVGNETNAMFYVGNAAAATTVTVNDFTLEATKSGLTSTQNSVQKRACSWGGVVMSATGNGLVPQSNTFDGSMNAATSIQIGCGVSGTRQLFGTLKNVRIYQTQFSDSQLQAITA